MKITVQQALTIANNNALTALDKVNLDPKTKWNLLKLSKQLDKELKEFDEFRNELIKTLGETDEQGNTKVKTENRQQFADQLQVVLDENTSELHTVTLPLSKLEGISLAVLSALEPFIDENN